MNIINCSAYKYVRRTQILYCKKYYGGISIWKYTSTIFYDKFKINAIIVLSEFKGFNDYGFNYTGRKETNRSNQLLNRNISSKKTVRAQEQETDGQICRWVDGVEEENRKMCVENPKKTLEAKDRWRDVVVAAKNIYETLVEKIKEEVFSRKNKITRYFVI